MADTIDITVPDLGDFEDVEVIEILVAAGDRVAEEDGLITLETDKASMDVPAPAPGELTELTVAVGDKVSTGDTIGRLSVEWNTAKDLENAADAASEKTADAIADVASGAASAENASESVTVTVPDIGDFADVDVIEVHVADGDSVAVDDPLVTLETDKAAMDVPSTHAGTVTSVAVVVGDTVSEGSRVVVLDAVAASPAQDATAKPQDTPKAPPKSASKADGSVTEPARTEQSRQGTLPPIDETGFSKAHAGPSVRKLARELGVNLAQVKGTGAKNRIVHDDVKAFVKSIMTGAAAPAGGAALPAVPTVDYAKFGDIREQPLNRIQKISGPRLQASWINLPHVNAARSFGHY